jgi:hypothetical protein
MNINKPLKGSNVIYEEVSLDFAKEGMELIEEDDIQFENEGD